MVEKRSFQSILQEKMKNPTLIDSIITKEMEYSYQLACRVACLNYQPLHMVYPSLNIILNKHTAEIQQQLQKKRLRKEPSDIIQPFKALNPEVQELAREQGISPQRFIDNVAIYEQEIKKLYKD